MTSDINLSKNGHLIFENVSPATEVGIDYHSWHVGPRFRGISNIPPGFHFIFFSSVDKHDQKSPRTGFFQFIKDGDIIVKLFDVENEDIKEVEIDENVKEQYIEELVDIGKYMAPYPAKKCEKWCSLSDNISESLLNRIQPIRKKIDFLTEVSLATAGKQRKSIMNLDSRIEHKEDPDGLIRFSDIPNKFPDNLTPQERTRYSIDSSYFLEKFIEMMEDGTNDILGELQFAFICFLIGQVYDAFDHWKVLVSFICNCEDSLSTRSEFFIKFIDLIRLQMKEIPDDFFVDIVAQNNFIVKTFQIFFGKFSCPDELSGTLLKKVSILKHELSAQFDCDFDIEDEDEMPVIVES